MTGVDLASNPVVSQMFRIFEKPCPQREVQPPDCNLSLVLQCSSRPLFEPLKLASGKHLNKKMSILHQPQGLMSYMASSLMFFTLVVGDPSPSPFFLAKTQNPLVPA